MTNDQFYDRLAAVEDVTWILDRAWVTGMWGEGEGHRVCPITAVHGDKDLFSHQYVEAAEALGIRHSMMENIVHAADNSDSMNRAARGHRKRMLKVLGLEEE